MFPSISKQKIFVKPKTFEVNCSFVKHSSKISVRGEKNPTLGYKFGR